MAEADDRLVEEEAASSPSKVVIEWLAIIVPLTTLLTALAFWYGWTLTNARTRYLGFDGSVFGFEATDFVVRSADALIVPLIVIAVIALLWIGLHALLVSLIQIDRWRRPIRIGSLVALVLAAAGLILSVVAIFVPVFDDAHYLTAPIVLGFSAALTAYAFAILRRTLPPSQAVTVVRLWQRGGFAVAALLVVVSMFWASTLYADALGRGRGMAVAQRLQELPAVTVYSEKDLGLQPPVERETIGDPDSAYTFRYTGLRLFLRSSDKYFLLPEGWTHGDGVAIVLRDDDDTRFEFSPGR